MPKSKTVWQRLKCKNEKCIKSRTEQVHLVYPGGEAWCNQCGQKLKVVGEEAR